MKTGNNANIPSGVRVKGRVFDFLGGFKSQISVRGMSLDSKDMKSSICFANYYLFVIGQVISLSVSQFPHLQD